jgi:hypothetical protein
VFLANCLSLTLRLVPAATVSATLRRARLIAAVERQPLGDEAARADCVVAQSVFDGILNPMRVDAWEGTLNVA